MPSLSSSVKIIRIIVGLIWGGIVASAIAVYLYDPSRFTAPNIALFIGTFQSEIWIVYLFLSAIRGITLLPSTPLIIAGTILFPTQPAAVLLVSLFGIFISSTMIYYFSELLGFSEFFASHRPELTSRLRRRLEHPTGLAFVAVWSFFPLVPTDAVCYVAGTIKMRFPLFISALLAGELVLCTIYIYLGGSILGSLFGR
jgi:uncharacterized membrane protein YdjX (TVP38/TMEM64 family)